MTRYKVVGSRQCHEYEDKDGKYVKFADLAAHDAQLRAQVIEECACIAEEHYDHRAPDKYDAYRRGEFSLSHEHAGDKIAAALRQRGVEGT